MIRTAILMAAISPSLLMLGYGIAKARSTWKSEAVWNTFFVGAVSAVAAIGLELLLRHLLPIDHMSPLADAATSAILLAAIPEETIKFFVLVSIAEKHVDVRRLQDTLALAISVSLGFAMLENFFYVISAGTWQITAVIRAITSVPGHGIDGLVMGALLIAARLSVDKKPGSVLYALLVPIVLHAAYDFPLFAIEKKIETIWFIGAWLLVLILSSIFMIILCNRMAARATEADRANGHDNCSVETTNGLIIGGIIALIAGPVLAGVIFYANGLAIASAVIVLSIFPVALGIDCIRTGLKRKRSRVGMNKQVLEPAR